MKPDTVRVGVLDNDVCALYAIHMVIREIRRRERVSLDVWTEHDPAKAVHRCCDTLPQTGVMLVDMSLGRISGVQVCRELRRRSRDIGIIGITAYDPEMYRRRMIEVGAQGLIGKEGIGSTLFPAIAAAAKGMPYPADGGFPSVGDACAHGDETTDAMVLTPQELLIVQLDLQHLSIHDIADRLHITEGTVSSHRRNIRRKLGVHSWSAAVDVYRDVYRDMRG